MPSGGPGAGLVKVATAHHILSVKVTIQTPLADVIYEVAKKVAKSSGWGWKSEVSARVDEMPCLRQVER